MSKRAAACFHHAGVRADQPRAAERRTALELSSLIARDELPTHIATVQTLLPPHVHLFLMVSGLGALFAKMRSAKNRQYKNGVTGHDDAGAAQGAAAGVGIGENQPDKDAIEIELVKSVGPPSLLVSTMTAAPADLPCYPFPRQARDRARPVSDPGRVPHRGGRLARAAHIRRRLQAPRPPPPRPRRRARRLGRRQARVRARPPGQLDPHPRHAQGGHGAAREGGRGRVPDGARVV